MLSLLHDGPNLPVREDSGEGVQRKPVLPERRFPAGVLIEIGIERSL
jgi:hypothetical protein